VGEKKNILFKNPPQLLNLIGPDKPTINFKKKVKILKQNFFFNLLKLEIKNTINFNYKFEWPAPWRIEKAKI